MGFSREEAKFWAAANKLAEREYAANFDDDSENLALRRLYLEFSSSETTDSVDVWLAKRLGNFFPVLDRRPDWVERAPKWPFQDGIPMTFLHQFFVGESEVASTTLTSNVTLYVFGRRVDVVGGWETQYRVVEQFAHMP